jgi:hypothetical protein
MYIFLISFVCATCTAHHILFDVITRIIFGEEYKLSNFLLCNFRQPPLASSILGILFSSTLNECPSFRALVSKCGAHPLEGVTSWLGNVGFFYRSVGIALGYGLDDRVSRVRFPEGAGNFSLHYRVQNGSGAHPASYPMGTRGSSLGVKRPRREADHSHPSNAEVK